MWPMTKYVGAYTSDSTPSPTSTTQSMGDASTLFITCHKLDGHNFLSCPSLYSCSFVDEARKTSSLSRSHNLNRVMLAWKAENNFVMSWLINSMLPEIGENFLLYSSAKDIWDAARESYSCRDDIAELSAIEFAILDLRQEDTSDMDYFSALTRLWQQMDLTESHD